MSALGENKICTFPEGSDLAARAPLVSAMQNLETAAAHSVALQSNASTTAYEAAMPYQEYFAGMGFLFLPVSTNTGAATLDLNNIGAKKLCDLAGAQITAAGAIVARRLYWLEYDATLDGAAGAFKVYNPDHLAAGTYTSVGSDAAIGAPKVNIALPHYAVRINWTGNLLMAQLIGHANTRLVGPHISPLGGIQFCARKDSGTSAVIFEMAVNNVSGSSKNKTLQIVNVDDNLHYQIDAGAITQIVEGSAINETGVITVPAGAHTLRLYLENDQAEFARLIMADWLDADVVWAAGGVYW